MASRKVEGNDIIVSLVKRVFKEVIITYLAGEFHQPLKVQSKKLRSPTLH